MGRFLTDLIYIQQGERCLNRLQWSLRELYLRQSMPANRYATNIPQRRYPESWDTVSRFCTAF